MIVEEQQNGDIVFREVEVDGLGLQLSNGLAPGSNYLITVKCERIKAQLPEGYYWGDNRRIVSTRCSWSVVGEGVFCEDGGVVPTWVFEAFKKEGLL